MSELEREEPRTPEFYTRAHKVFKDLGFKDKSVTDQDCDIARWACEVVATRAARLSAVGLAAVIKKTNAAAKVIGPIQIGVDGRYVGTNPAFGERSDFTNCRDDCAAWQNIILTSKRECGSR